MNVGDKVRSKPGFEDTIIPGYEGVILDKDGPYIHIQISKIPDQLGQGDYEVPDHQNIDAHSLEHKWEVIG